MSKREDEDPFNVEVRERLAKVETRLEALNGMLEDVKKRVETLDSRLWWLLGSVIISILLALAKIFV